MPTPRGQAEVPDLGLVIFGVIYNESMIKIYNFARSSSAVIRVSIFCFAIFALPTSADLASKEEILDRIQRECLRAYPPELLAKMASGAREIPEEVETDPEAQMNFLDKEIPRDKGLFYPILLEDMLPAFDRFVSPGKRFLDLGSGDGRVVFLAGVLGADAFGIEYDKQLVKISRQAGKALSDVVDPKRWRIKKGDFFKSSWSGYDVIFFFDLSSFEPERVRQKLQREMDLGALLIVGFEQSPFPGLELVERDRPNHPAISIYRQPTR